MLMFRPYVVKPFNDVSTQRRRHLGTRLTRVVRILQVSHPVTVFLLDGFRRLPNYLLVLDRGFGGQGRTIK